MDGRNAIVFDIRGYGIQLIPATERAASGSES